MADKFFGILDSEDTITTFRRDGVNVVNIFPTKEDAEIALFLANPNQSNLKNARVREVRILIWDK